MGASINQVKALLEKRNTLLGEVRQIVDIAAGDKRSNTPEETAKITERFAAVEVIDADYKTLETLAKHEKSQEDFRSTLNFANAAADKARPLPGKAAELPGKASDPMEDYRSAFGDWARTGNRVGMDALGCGIPGGEDMRSVMSEGSFTGAAGTGIVGTQLMQQQWVEVMKSYAGIMRAGVDIWQTPDGNPINYLKIDDTANAAAIQTEAQSVTTETAPTLTNGQLVSYLLNSAWVRVSWQLLRDNFQAEQQVMGALAKRIGRQINTYGTTGTGSSQPAGVVTGAASGVSGDTTPTFGDIVNLMYSIDEDYQENAKFMLHRTTMAALVGLVDTYGRPIFDNYIAGNAVGGFKAIGTIRGAPAILNSAMPTLQFGNKAILYGDFNAFKLRLVGNVQILRTVEMFAQSGQVGFLAIQAMDSVLPDSTAIKYLICTVT